MVALAIGNLSAIRHPGDHLLQHWQAAGLLRPSLLQAKIATVETSIIERRLGRLTGDDLEALKRGLREALDLA